MLYSIHAWQSDQQNECFKDFAADPTDPVLAIQASMELLMDNPIFTLVMVRMWYQVVRFDHELGAVQFIRVPGSSNITTRVDRLVNLLARGKEERVFRGDVLVKDRKPVKVQLEFGSPEDVILNKDKLMPYLLDDPPSQIVIPV
jgi:hypothetical protein